MPGRRPPLLRTRTRRRRGSPSEYYVNTINVMRGAEGVDAYAPIPEQEAFDIEYWVLEEAKLKRLPKAEEPGGPDRARHRRRRAASAARPRGGSWPKRRLRRDHRHRPGRRSTSALAGLPGRTAATASGRFRCDVTQEASVRDSYAYAAREFGGLDICGQQRRHRLGGAGGRDDARALEPQPRHPGHRLLPGGSRRLRPAEAPGAGRLDRLRRQQERARGLGGRRRLLHGQGRRDPPRPLPGPRGRRASASASTW